MPTGPSTQARDFNDAECSTSKSTEITFTEIPPDLSPPSPPFEFPKEVLVKILRHLPFSDLYGSVQYVNKHWSYLVRQRILSSKTWLDTITSTDYIALFHTCSGSLQDPDLQSGSKASVVSWDGVGCIHKSFNSSLPPLYRALATRLTADDEYYSTSDFPYIISAKPVPIADLDDLSDDSYDRLKTVNALSRRPVELQVLEWSPKAPELHLDLHDCYRAIYWQYQRLTRESRQLIENLEADLWLDWSREHERHWGKKRAGKYLQGRLIEKVINLHQSMTEEGIRMIDILQRWDLTDRRLSTYEQATTYYLSQTSLEDLNLDRSYRFQPASWHESPAMRTIIRHGDRVRVRSQRRAAFGNTIARMASLFHWHESLEERILSDSDYRAMLDEWFINISSELHNTRIITEVFDASREVVESDSD